jgi:hypothetical protein
MIQHCKKTTNANGMGLVLYQETVGHNKLVVRLSHSVVCAKPSSDASGLPL